MEDHCLWEEQKLHPQEFFNETTLPSHGENVWLLETLLLGITVSPIQKANSPSQ
jgi:hypothetical protein